MASMVEKEPLTVYPQLQFEVPEVRIPEIPQTEDDNKYELPDVTGPKKLVQPETEKTEEPSYEKLVPEYLQDLERIVVPKETEEENDEPQSILDSLRSQMAEKYGNLLTPEITNYGTTEELPEKFSPELKYHYEQLPRLPEWDFQHPEPLYIPDVKVSNLNIPGQVSFEEKFIAEFTVENSNKGTGNMKVALFDGQSINPVKVWDVTLQGNDKLKFTHRHAYKSQPFDLGGRPAQFKMKVVANYQDLMTEFNKENNELSRKIKVYKKVKQADIYAELVTHDAEITVGEEAEFMVRLVNLGNAATGEFLYKVNFGDGEVYSITTGLNPGEDKFNLVKHQYTNVNLYNVVLNADATNHLRESDETNNVARVTVDVSAPVEVLPNKAPEAVCVLTPTSGEVPMHVVAECGYSSDSDGYIAGKEFRVEGPDGIREINEIIDMIYEFDITEAGDYRVTYVIEDNDGARARWMGHVSGEVTESVENPVDPVDPEDPIEDPIDPVEEVFEAVLTITPDQGLAPLNVVIDGSESTGIILQHSWIITGPQGYTYNEYGNSGEPSVLNLTFEEVGTYTVRLHLFGENGSEIVYYNVEVEDPESENPVDLVDPEDPTDPSNHDNESPVVVCEITPETKVGPVDVTIDCSETYDVEDKISAYTLTLTKYVGGVWMNEWVETANAESQIPAFTYTLEHGRYEVVLEVWDDELALSKWSTSFAVDNANSNNSTDPNDPTDPADPEDPSDPSDPADPANDNQAPVAIVSTNPSGGIAPLNVTVSGEQSYDSDGEIVSHSWIINGPEFQYINLGVSGVPGSLDLELLVVGDYSVRLIVTDDEGAAMDIETTITLTGEGTDDNNGTDDGSDDGTGDGNDDGTDDSNDNTGDDDNGNDDDNTDDDGNDDSNENSDLPTPDIKHVDVRSITYESARIEWETDDVETTSRVYFGTDDDDLDDDEYNSDLTFEHEIELDNLDEKTKYYYTVKSCNANDECDEEGPFQFTTLMETSDSDDSDSDSDWDNYTDEWGDLSLSTDDFLRNINSNSQTEEDEKEESEPVVESPSVEVIYATTQYIEVEGEVCKLKFLWWCVWKEKVMKKIPLPNVMGGIEFVI